MQRKSIQILPEFIANQIAAGEVVQRPESVVKELVENSFDAGADTIMVIVKDAGKSLIHIIDNGHGMSREDLSLSIRRHATSKVFTSEDLEAIHTFGFRGEALASIASVSNIEIRTLPQGEEHGWRLTAEPMKDPVIEPFAIDIGTQIFVRNLFYNLPARKKFLKTNLTEFRYISETMLRFALSKPDIRFVFYDDNTLIFDAQPGPLKKRIQDVIGESTAKAIIPLNHEENGIKLHGYIGLPSIAKQTRSNQYLFLNSRSIQSKSINFAVFSAYEHLLEKSKNPFYLINIELDPHEYDVNVHPQKHEVKFEDERLIHNIVNRAVVRALAENSVIPDASLDSIEAITPFKRVVVENEELERETLLVNKVTGEIIDKQEVPSTSSDRFARLGMGNSSGNKDYNYSFPSTNAYNSANLNSASQSYNSSANYSRDENASQSASSYNAYIPPAPSKPMNFDVNIFKPDAVPTPKDAPRQEFFVNQDTISHYEILKEIVEGDLYLNYLQIHNKYLILEVPSGILLFDQHGAHERVLYEKVLRSFSKDLSNSQDLLFPHQIILDNSEVIVLKEIKEELNELGYYFELKGNQLEVKAIPLDDAYVFSSVSIKEVIDQYAAEQKIRNTDKRDYLAASIACKAAIKTGKSIRKEEMMKLISDLLACDMPYCCPHGRPIIIEMSLYRLDRLFGRIL